jgi:hypothetical protein
MAPGADSSCETGLLAGAVDHPHPSAADLVDNLARSRRTSGPGGGATRAPDREFAPGLQSWLLP